MTARRLAWPDLALGAVVGVLGVWEATSAGRSTGSGAEPFVIAVAMAAAVGLSRLAPLVALGLVWVACSVQLAGGLDVALVQLTTVFVSYGTARYGHALTLWLSGLSIPVGAAIALFYLRDRGSSSLVVFSKTIAPNAPVNATSAFLLALLLLASPWALGLVLRLRSQFRLARAQRQQAEVEAARSQEIAHVRADQARLARDVHDVVGHSLAVILAQADSVEFMDDSNTDQIRSALVNISTSARESLGDVRRVLSSTSDQADGVSLPTGGLDSLIEGVRSAGNDIRSRVEGIPRPMPPELDMVAFRVLQEMLTNALKHGRRGVPIVVERFWEAEDLRVEVRNFVADEVGAELAAGLGLPGMKQRLDAVHGRLDVRRDASSAGTVFTATAWVPVRPRGGGS